MSTRTPASSFVTPTRVRSQSDVVGTATADVSALVRNGRRQAAAAPPPGRMGRWALLGLAVALGCADSQPADNHTGAGTEDTGEGPEDGWDSYDWNADEIAQQTYVAELFDGTTVSPMGIGALLADEMGSLEIALRIEEMDGDNADLVVGWGSRGEQDLCVPTTDLEASFFGRQLSVSDATMEVPFSGGETIPLVNMSLEATIERDGSGIELEAVSGELDVRDMASAAEVLGVEDPRDICEVLVNFAIECEHCTSDGEPYCVPVEVVDLYASPASYTLEERTDEDIADDGICAGVTSCSHAPAGRSGAWGLLGLGMFGLLLRRRG